MALLGFCQGFEPICNFVESFVACRTRHARIHIRIFVRFTGNRRFQIIGSTADGLACRGIAGFFEVLQMAVSVAGLAFRSRPENSGDIVVTFDIRLLGRNTDSGGSPGSRRRKRLSDSLRFLSLLGTP